MTKRPILIQTAMKVECQKIINTLDNLQETEIQTYKFYEGTINNYPIIVSLSKVGLIQASASLTIAILKYNPLAIINIGIAGATAKHLHLKDIIVGEKCLNINSYRTGILEEHQGTSPNSWELLTFLSGEEDRLIEQAATPDLIDLTKQIPLSQNQKIYYGKIGSGDVWNREVDRLLYLNKEFNILCEDMEAIATYTLANQANISVISLKMISDNSLTGEEYDREIGQDMQAYALQYLQKLIINL